MEITALRSLPADDPRAVAMTAAIQDGDIASLRRLLEAHPDLVNMPIANKTGVARTPVLIATDWPGHFPQVATTISILAAAGADVNVRLPPHPKDANCMETPLHQAASSNDVAAIDALLDAGADINATGAIFTAGGPLSDAVIFANWDAAKRLVDRGADVEWWQAAALACSTGCARDGTLHRRPRVRRLLERCGMHAVVASARRLKSCSIRAATLFGWAGMA